MADGQRHMVLIDGMAFKRTPEDGIVAVGNGLASENRLGTGDIAIVTRVFPTGSLHLSLLGVNGSLQHNLGVGRHVQIHRFAGHHVDGLTPNGTGDLHLIQGIYGGDAGHEAQGGFLPDDHGHLHRLVFFELLIIVLSDMLAGGVELDTGLCVAVHHHHPVGSAVHPTCLRVLGDHRVKSPHQSPAVSLVPVRDG